MPERPSYSSKNNKAIKKKLTEVLSGGKYSYDAASDSVYRNYKDSTLQNARKASEETASYADSINGGHKSTYADKVSNASMNRFNAKTNSLVPGLMEQDYKKHKANRQTEFSGMNALTAKESTEYGRHRNSVSDYENQRSFSFQQQKLEDSIANTEWEHKHQSDLEAYEREQKNKALQEKIAKKLKDKANEEEILRNEKKSQVTGKAESQSKEVSKKDKFFGYIADPKNQIDIRHGLTDSSYFSSLKKKESKKVSIETSNQAKKQDTVSTRSDLYTKLYGEKSDNKKSFLTVEGYAKKIQENEAQIEALKSNIQKAQQARVSETGSYDQTKAYEAAWNEQILKIERENEDLSLSRLDKKYKDYSLDELDAAIISLKEDIKNASGEERKNLKTEQQELKVYQYNKQYAETVDLIKKDKAVADIVSQIDMTSDLEKKGVRWGDWDGMKKSLLSGELAENFISYSLNPATQRGNSSIASDKSKNDATQKLNKLGYNGKTVVDIYTREHNRIKADIEEWSTTERAEEHPVISSIESVPLGIIKSSETVKQLGNTVANKITGNYNPTDYNTAGYRAGQQQNAIRGQVASEIESGKTGKAGAFVYQTGMSIADSLATRALMGDVSTVVMGMGAASDTARAGAEKGLNENQIALTSLSAGVAEWMFESIELEQLKAFKSKNVDGIKTFLGNMGKQMINEGTGEAATDLMNTITDNMINGGASEFAQSVDAYMKSGLSFEDAKKKSSLDVAKQMGLSFVGGALSGAVMGTGYTAVGTYNQSKKTNNALTSSENMGSSSDVQKMGFDSSVQKNNSTVEQNNSSTKTGTSTSNKVQDMRKAFEVINSNSKVPDSVYEAKNGFTRQEVEAVREANKGDGQAAVGSVVDIHGEKAKLKRVYSSKEGNIQMLLTDSQGSDIAIDLQEITGESNDINHLLTNTANYGENGVKGYISGYDGSIGADVYTKGFNAYYNAGITGLGVENVISAYGELLPDSVKTMAYANGINDAQKTQTMNFENSSNVMGKGTFTVSAKSNISENEKEMLSSFAKTAGIDIKMVEDDQSNGYYADGTIYISDSSDNKNMVVVLHEFTHHLEKVAPKEFKIYRDEVINFLKGENQSKYNQLENHIRTLYESQDLHLTEESLLNEIAANATESFLANPGQWTKQIAENRTFIQKLMEFLNSFVDYLKDQFKNHDSKDAGARMLQGNVEELERVQKLWNDAFEVAGNYKKEDAKESIDSNLRVDPEKNKTNTLLKGTGLQLPFASKEYDLIKKITEKSDKGNSLEDVKHSLKDTSDIVETVSETGEISEKFEKIVSMIPVGSINRTSLYQISKTFLQKYNSKYDINTMVSNLEKLSKYVNEDYAKLSGDVMDATASMAKKILESSSVLDTSLKIKYADLLKELKETKIKVSDVQKTEISSKYDSYNAFRKKYFGKIGFSNDGTAIQSLYQQMEEKYPELFGSEVSDKDMAIKIAKIVDAINEPVFKSEVANEGSLDEKSYQLAAEIFSSYLSASKFGDSVNAEKIKKMKLDYQKSLTEYKSKINSKYQEDLRIMKKELKDGYYKKTNDRLYEKYLSNMAKYRITTRERWQETQEKKKFRESIKKNAKSMMEWLNNPTDKKHVPEAFRKTTLELMNSINFISDYAQADSKTTMQWTSAMQKIANQVSLMENGTIASDNGFYADFINSIDPDFLPRVYAFIGSDREHVKLYSNNLGVEDLKELDYIISILKRAITSVNQMYANNFLHDNEKAVNVADIGDGTIAELKRRKDKKNHAAAVEMAATLLNVDNLDAYSYFHQLGEHAQSVYDEIREGFNKKVQRIHEAQTYMMAGIKDVDVSKWTGDKADVHTFKSGDGEIKLTTSQIMSLYLLSQREQAQLHLTRGGVKPTQIGNGKKSITQFVPVHLSQIEIGTIISTLTEEQRRVADYMQKFLADNCASWGNEVSSKMWGYNKYTDKKYFPIKTDSNTNKTSDKNSGNSSLYAIRNLGMTKNVVEGANNAVILGDVFEIFTDHVTDMANYNGLMLPITDAMKWFNYSDKTDMGEFNKVESVKEQMERVYGPKSKMFFTNLIKDINGDSGKGYASEISSKLVSNYKAASVGANIRVAVQQPTAYFRALTVLDAKYLFNPKISKNASEKVKQNSAIALWKSWGYFETDIGQSMKSVITGQKSTVERVKDAAMILAQRGDDLTWGVLWGACERETIDKYPALKYDSEEFVKKTAKRFDEVIDRTQVVDTVLHRSQIMRSKNGLVQAEMSFMSEPTKSFNMLRNAILDFGFAEEGDKKEKTKQLARTLVSWSVSTVAATMAAAVIDAMRDREDKDFADKYIKGASENILYNLNPLSMIPYVKDIFSLMQGYSIDRIDMGGISNLIDAMKQVFQMVSGKSKNPYNVLKQVARAVSQCSGISAYNVWRDLESFYNTISAEKLGMTKTDENNNTKNYKSNLIEALQADNPEDIVKYYNSLIKTGKDPKDIDNIIVKDLFDNNPEIKTAADMKKNNDLEAYAAAVDELVAKGNKRDIVIKAIDKHLKDNEEEENKDTYYEYDEIMKDDSDNRMFSKKNLIAAVESENVENLEKIKQDAILAKTKEYEQDPQKDVKYAKDAALDSLRTAITEAFKPKLIASFESGDKETATKLTDFLTQNMGYENDDFKSWIGGALKKDYQDAYTKKDSAKMQEIEAKAEKIGYTYSEMVEWTGRKVYQDITESLDPILQGESMDDSCIQFRDERYQRFLDEGKTEWEAKSAIKDGLTGYYKPLYKEMSPEEQSRLRTVLSKYFWYGKSKKKNGKYDFSKWLKYEEEEDEEESVSDWFN